MSLTVSITLTFSKTQAIITDVTGAYDVTDNPGGYGSPNDAFADFAHYAILRKKNVATDDEVLTLDSYDPLTATEFTCTRSIDGWYEAKKLNIPVWSAGTYGADDVVYRAGSVYKANTTTTGTPGSSVDWDVVTDLTTIEDNESITVTTLGRVTAYNANSYWGQQIANNTEAGYYGTYVDDKQKQRLEKIYDLLQAALVADQLGSNEEGELAVQGLILLGAK